MIEFVTQAGEPVRYPPSRLLRRSEYSVGGRLPERHRADDPASAARRSQP